MQLRMSEVRQRITVLPEELETEPVAVTVTRRGKPVLAILPWELYESLVETLEVLGDRELMKALRKSIKEMRQGKLRPLEKVVASDPDRARMRAARTAATR